MAVYKVFTLSSNTQIFVFFANWKFFPGFWHFVIDKFSHFDFHHFVFKNVYLQTSLET